MRRTLAVIATLGLLMAGCSGDDDSTQDDDSTNSEPTIERTTDPEPTEDSPLIVPFGEPVTYDDGFTVTVHEPEHYDVDACASADEPTGHIAITTDITNGDQGIYETVAWGAWARVAHAELEPQLLDCDETDTILDYTDLMPGHSTSYTAVYATDTLDGLTVAVEPDMALYAKYEPFYVSVDAE